MDRNWAEQGVKPGSALRAVARMYLVLQGKVVRPARFELATSCSGGKRSIQLSYGRTEERGARRYFSLFVGELPAVRKEPLAKELREIFSLWIGS